MQKILKVNEKLLPFLTKPQPIKVVFGGRGSGKSIGLADMGVAKMERERIDLYCLREFHENIADSFHRTLSTSITERLKLEGWDVQRETILSPHGNRTAYKGAARNATGIQGAENYRLSIFTEAHAASQESIDRLLPTILRKPGAQCWFDANPQSSSDPFSQRFIVPYLEQIERDGFYEDDLHYIVKVNWRDNPWWGEEQEMLRAWDYENLPRAKYDWIWEGEFNDSVENSIITSEWFDACIDAHLKLGFGPKGVKVASHDPSDLGGDAKGFALRHGSVILDVKERVTGDVNEGCDWAIDEAIKSQADYFVWDVCGLGAGLKRQVDKGLEGKRMAVVMFNGAETPFCADAIYEPASVTEIHASKRISEVFVNKRAQCYIRLADRVYRTYRAVTHGEYINPDEMISFSSSIENIQKLRSEICRIPRKPNKNGRIELYRKDEMRKMKIPSPNMADAVMQTMADFDIYKPRGATFTPPPILKTVRR